LTHRLVSNGYASDRDADEELDAVAAAAAAHGVCVFAIDGRIPENASLSTAACDAVSNAYLAARASLRLVVERSGGFAIFPGAELPDALRRIGSLILQ
jgi:hypothetical protein